MITDEIEPTGPSLTEILYRRKLIALCTFLILAITSFTLSAAHKPKFGALSHVVLVNDMNGRAPADAGIDMPALVTSSSVLSEARRRLALTDSVSDLRAAVTARIAPRSSLMTIAVQNKNAEKAVQLDNAVSDSFVAFYRQLASSRYDNVMHRLNADLTDSRGRVRNLERRLEIASAGASYVGSQASLDATASHLGELTENLGATLAQRATDEAVLRSDRARPNADQKAIRHEILTGNAAYRETEALIATDIAKYTTTRASVTASFPGIAGFQDKILNERNTLQSLRHDALNAPEAFSITQSTEAAQFAHDRAAVDGDDVKVADLGKQIRALTSKPLSSISIGALRAERDAAELQLQTLSQRLSNAEANSAESTSLGEVVVVDRATEARATMLNSESLFALGMAAAVVFAILAAYLADLVNPIFLGSADIEKVYGRRLLTTVRARQ